MSFLSKIQSRYVVGANEQFPFVAALKRLGTFDLFFPALDKWLDGDIDPLLEMYRKRQIPIIERSSASLCRCVMVSPKEYEAFMKAGQLKPMGVLQSWSESELIGTPYKNIKKPIYLHFEHEVKGSDIVLHLPDDLWAYKHEGEIAFDRYDLIEQEAEVICKSMTLNKSQMDWEPFIPECFEDEDGMDQICDQFGLDFGDAHSM